MPAPVMKSDKMPVVCFAPPLTDELLAKYETLIAGCKDPKQKDTLETLYRCVKAWWDIPVSKRTDGTPWKIKHGGKNIEYTETPLEDEHVKQLDPVTPWDHELAAMRGVVDGIQEAQAVRNSGLLESWGATLRSFLLKQALSAEEYAWQTSDEWKASRRMLKAVADTMSRQGNESEEYAEGAVSLYSKGTQTRASLKAIAEKVKAVDAEVTAIKNGQKESPIPKPAMESVELRDCGHMLLWYATEIELGREPLTQEVLVQSSP